MATALADMIPKDVKMLIEDFARECPDPAARMLKIELNKSLKKAAKCALCREHVDDLASCQIAQSKKLRARMREKGNDPCIHRVCEDCYNGLVGRRDHMYCRACGPVIDICNYSDSPHMAGAFQRDVSKAYRLIDGQIMERLLAAGHIM